MPKWGPISCLALLFWPSLVHPQRKTEFIDGRMFVYYVSVAFNQDVIVFGDSEQYAGIDRIKPEYPKLKAILARYEPVVLWKAYPGARWGDTVGTDAEGNTIRFSDRLAYYTIFFLNRPVPEDEILAALRNLPEVRKVVGPVYVTIPDGPEQYVRNVLISQQTAWNRGDIKGFMDGYWKSDRLLFTSGGNTQRGWEATFEKYQKAYDTKAKMGLLTFRDLEIRMLSTESAWVFGRWELERTEDRPHGVFTLVLRKFSEGWKIVHDHTTSEKEK